MPIMEKPRMEEGGVEGKEQERKAKRDALPQNLLLPDPTTCILEINSLTWRYSVGSPFPSQ